MKYAPVTLVLPDGTDELIPLPAQWRGARLYAVATNPTMPSEQRIAARVQALHAATAWAGHLLPRQLVGIDLADMPESERERVRHEVLIRAAQLEEWLLRPVPDPTDGADWEG